MMIKKIDAYAGKKFDFVISRFNGSKLFDQNVHFAVRGRI